MVIVTSAAIACGLEALGIAKRPGDMPSLQAAASVGQSALSTAYAEAFGARDMLTSVVLLTRRDTKDRSAYLHARDTLTRLLELSVVPVVNENDTVSVEQIRFGDNDTLAALGGLPHRCRPHGDPLGYRRAVHGEPADRSGRPRSFPSWIASAATSWLRPGARCPAWEAAA